jgi:hypothetical protein
MEGSDGHECLGVNEKTVGGCDGVAANGHCTIRGEELHPLVRGFLNLCRKVVVVPLAYLAILLGVDYSPERGTDLDEVRGAGTANEDAQEVIFERLWLSFDAKSGPL